MILTFKTKTLKRNLLVQKTVERVTLPCTFRQHWPQHSTGWTFVMV